MRVMWNPVGVHSRWRMIPGCALRRRPQALLCDPWVQSQVAYAEVISQRRDTDSSFTCGTVFPIFGNSPMNWKWSPMNTHSQRSEHSQFHRRTANSQQYKGRLIAYRKDPNAGPETEYSLHHRNYNPQPESSISRTRQRRSESLSLCEEQPRQSHGSRGLLDDHSYSSHRENHCLFYEPYYIGGKFNGDHYVGEIVLFLPESCSTEEIETRPTICLSTCQRSGLLCDRIHH